MKRCYSIAWYSTLPSFAAIAARYPRQRQASLCLTGVGNDLLIIEWRIFPLLLCCMHSMRYYNGASSPRVGRIKNLWDGALCKILAVIIC